jgi:protein-tyrosine phosphatase
VTTNSEGLPVFAIGGVQIDPDFPVDIKWVRPQLAFGSMIGTVRNMRTVAEAGITHVINLQDEFDDSTIVENTGIRVHWPQLGRDLRQVPIDSALQFAEEALRSPGHSLFVHCLAGRNRSASLTYAILLLLEDSDADARKRIRKAEPDAVLDEDVLQMLSRGVANYRQQMRRRDCR